MVPLKEDHGLQLNFHLSKHINMSWSQLFDQMEEISREMSIDDYTLSQTTLEQVRKNREIPDRKENTRRSSWNSVDQQLWKLHTRMEKRRR